MSGAIWMMQHRRSLLTLLFFIALMGAVRSLDMPVSLFPQVNFPRVVVSLSAGDQPSDQMEIQVTRLAEVAIRSVPDVVGLRSNTSRGSTDISVNFDWGTDMVAATLQVSAALSQVQSQFPASTSFTVRRMDTTVFPALAYSLTSENLSQIALRDLANFNIVPMLSSIQGVARIGVLGGDEQEYRVTIDPDRLRALGLGVQQVVDALQSNNVLRAVGRVEDYYKLFLAISDTRFDHLDDIRHTVLKTGVDGFIELQDVAMVSQGVKPRWIRVTADGSDAVLIMVYQQRGSNTVQIAQHVRDKLDLLQQRISRDIHIKHWYDQSELIQSSVKSVRDAIFIGIALAALVLLAFLRNIRVTFITLITVPAVFATTVLILDVFHFSFNIMTLGGMAAAVGLVIDDAIVMIEQIMRQVRQQTAFEGEHESTVMQAVRDFFHPLLGSSLATTIIFLPLAFMTGVTGAFFQALSVTMACSLVVSFVVAWLAVPLLASFLLKDKDAEAEDEGFIQQKIIAAYRVFLGFVLHRTWLLVPVVLGLMLAGYNGYQHVGSGFMPKMDEGGFVLDYVGPSGMSLTETDRLLQKVAATLKQVPEVDTWSRRTGASLGEHITEVNEGDFFVRLHPLPRRSLEEVMDDVRERLHAAVPALDIELIVLMEDLIGDLTAVPQPIEIQLFGDDVLVLERLAPKVAAAVEKIDGVVDVKDGMVVAGDAWVIQVDRAKAALEGMTPAGVTAQLETWLSGTVSTSVQQGQKMVSVRVWSDAQTRDAMYKLDHIQLKSPDGHWFPLLRVAQAQHVSGQPQITRDNLQRMVAVTGRISGRDLGSVMRDVKALLATDLIPNHVRVELGGLYLQQQQAFDGLIQVFVAAIVLVFVLLLFLYERFVAALSILAMPLLAMGMVFLGLWISDTELNITSMMGLTMIIGIVTETAIFYYSEFRRITQGRHHHFNDYIQAGCNRFRPIAMTSLVAILALMPLALAWGEGSEMLQPMAIAIVFGLMAQFPLVLWVLPVLLYGLDRRGHRVKSS